MTKSRKQSETCTKKISGSKISDHKHKSSSIVLCCGSKTCNHTSASRTVSHYNSKTSKSKSNSSSKTCKSKSGSKTCKSDSKTRKSDSKTRKAGSKTCKAGSKTCKSKSQINSKKTIVHKRPKVYHNIKNDKKGISIPEGTIVKKYIPNKNLLKENSLAASTKAKYLSPRNDIKAMYVPRRSNFYFLFNCPDCKHEFFTTPDLIYRDQWCGYCASKFLCGNCDYCNNKSFANHEKADFWSLKNEKEPKFMFSSSNSPCTFDCPDCGHEFSIRLDCITNQDQWCGYCNGENLCQNSKCDFCFKKSFASHMKILNEKNVYWSNENSLEPRQICMYSHNKYRFECKNGKQVHIFNSELYIMGHRTGCPICTNKTQAILYDTLKNLYPDLINEYKQKWCKNISYLPFDFCLPTQKIIIELDGAQHFRQIMNWACPIKTHETDIYKMKCANDNKFRVIRILQEDVYRNKYEWLKELQANIKKLTNSNKIKNIFMCKHNEYNIFIRGTIEYNIMHMTIDGYSELNDVDDLMSLYGINKTDTDKLFVFISNTNQSLKGHILYKNHDKHTKLMLVTLDNKKYSIKYNETNETWNAIPKE